MDLQGKTVLVTGASSGLGRAVALALGRRSNNLVVTGRRRDRLEELASEIESSGGRCTVVAGDATDPRVGEEVVAAGIRAYGRIDVALLNAGGGTAVTMADATSAQVLAVMRTNYDTLVGFLCPLIAHMKAEGGVIAFTGSPAGYFGLPRSGPYSAAKAAARVLIDTCRIELAGTDVRLVALYPGFTATEGLQASEVPFESLIIGVDRAAREMIRAIERERSHYLFPKRIRWLIAFARLMPEPLRRRVLIRFA